MKKTIVAVLLASLALAFVGCTRCTVCTTIHTNPTDSTTTIYAEDEHCDRNLTAWEDEQIEYAGWLNKTGGYNYYSCTCVRE